jgi:beta-glucosidase
LTNRECFLKIEYTEYSELKPGRRVDKMGKMRIIASIVLLSMVFTSCSPKDSSKSTDAAVAESKKTKEKVAQLVKEMSLEEKAGQMIQGSRESVTAAEVEELGLGSVLSGGGSYPGSNTIEDWSGMMLNLQNAAMKTKHHIPILYGLDAVHGLGLVKGAVVFPHNIGIGAANNPELTYQMGAAVAEEMKLIKTLWNFSPCVAVSADPRWGRTYECYSSDPKIVSSMAEAFFKGQSEHGVTDTAKHYVADGGTLFGTGVDGLVDQGNAAITDEQLRAVYMPPYETLVKAGVQVVMASYSSVNGVKMNENKNLLTDVLKGELGFKGFVISDWEAIKQLDASSYEEKVALSVNAGVDMLMEPENFEEARNAIVNDVNIGSIPIARVDDAVSRILTVKYNMGLFEDPYMEKLNHEVTELGSEKYRAVAKQLVEQSLVLLKNDKNVLPLKKGQKIFVTGPAADDMGMQCGGWGLEWVGQLDEGNGKVTDGTTILEGIKEYAAKYGLEVITDEKRAQEADVVILATGEVPYAEYYGDTEDLSITGDKAHPDNEKYIEYAKSLNKPVVSLIVAGRNVLINGYMDNWDSIVMCYLPGSEGEGIASVLFGETNFSGKLPMPYYKSVSDIGNKNADLLFDKGYGLDTKTKN